MFVALLYVLLYIAVAVLAVVVIIWFVEQIIGLAIPARIKQLLWVIVLLLCVIYIVEVVPFPPLPAPHWR